MWKGSARGTGAGLLGLVMGFTALDAGAYEDDRLVRDTGYLDLSAGTLQGGFWFEHAPPTGGAPLSHVDESGDLRRATFAMTRRQGEMLLRWGAARGERQQLREAGIEVGSFGVGAFSGDGDSVSDAAHAWSGAGHYQFHGGFRHDYDFDGLQFSWRPGADSRVALTRASVRAAGLETREVSQFDLGLGAHSLTLLEVASDGERAGRALGLGTRLGPLAMTLQHMAAENDATWSALTLATRTRGGKTLSMRVEQSRNPLYDVANDNRVVFSLGYRLAGGGILRAAETAADPADAEAAKKSKTVPILIGVGAVGAALALSSGGGNEGDSRPRFQSQNAAARQVLDEVNPRSIAQNREWGGYIYRRADGSYSSTAAVQGSPASVSLPSPDSAVPGNSAASATYHTHAAFDPRYDNENFSPQDLLSDITFGLDGYLGTPQGQFKLHDVSRGRVITIGGPGTLAVQ